LFRGEGPERTIDNLSRWFVRPSKHDRAQDISFSLRRARLGDGGLVLPWAKTRSLSQVAFLALWAKN
jgi:hypothetical protein